MRCSSTAVLFLLPLLACSGDGTGMDSADTVVESESIVLESSQQVRFSLQLDADTLSLASGTDITVDWSALGQSDLGGALDPGAVEEVRLRQFSALSPDALLAGLAAGSIAQTDVSVTLRCRPDAGVSQCAFSAFTFEAGHHYDTVGAFTAGSGTWLVEVFSQAGQPADARLLLLADDAATGDTATVDDDSSALLVSLTGKPVGIATVAEAVTLDWSAVSETGSGGALVANRFETALLIPTAEGDTAESLILDPQSAEPLAAVDVYGETTLLLEPDWLTAGSLWLVLTGQSGPLTPSLALFLLEPR
jgi:hypothetical protein